MTTDYTLKIDSVLKDFLQKNIKILIDNKFYKEGKFILFTHGYFNFNFHIINSRKNKIEIVKLPVPFLFENYEDDGILYFDYRIKTFCKGVEEVEEDIKKIKKSHLSKFWDRILEIEIKT